MMLGPGDGLFWLVMVIHTVGGTSSVAVIPAPYNSESACQAAAERWDRMETTFYVRTHECIKGADRP